MSEITVVVAGTDCGRTPLMPFVGERFDGRIFTEPTKYLLQAALLRCGFDVVDVKQPITDCQDTVMLANRVSADCIAVTSYGAFGSRKSFNDVCGMTVRYYAGRTKNRTLAEDVCAKLLNKGKCTILPDREPSGAACPAIIIDGGYLTNFDEAKAAHDPDYRTAFAEYAAMGICEYFDLPYIPREEKTCYPALNPDDVGKRGTKVKQLQALLCAHGYKTDVDGVIGRNTSLAAKTFMINNEPHVNTNALICLALPEYCGIPFGAKSATASYVQHKLRSKLYPCELSGVLDSQTLTALNEFLNETNSGLSSTEQSGVTAEMIDLLKPVGGGRPRLF